MAYIRFASVYRDFKDVREFKAELEELLNGKRPEAQEVIGERSLMSSDEADAQDYVDSGRWDWAGGFGGGGARFWRRRERRREWSSSGTDMRRGRRRSSRPASTFRRRCIDSIEENRVALKGPVTTPMGGGFSSINVTLRQKFELFANFRPVKNLPGLKTRYPELDLIIVRENMEDLYAGLEHEVVPGVVQALKIITEKGSTRIAKFAFEYARKHGRKKIHAIHKANIMKLSDGLFLRCCRKVREGFPEIEYHEHIVDNTCMQLVMNPYQYDILLTENLYGDILSDLCSAFVGGLGLVPGANLGTNCAIFEAVHGSAPDIAGKDLANPTALLQSAVLMLHHINESGDGGAGAECAGTGVSRGQDADQGCRRHEWDAGVRGGGIAGDGFSGCCGGFDIRGGWMKGWSGWVLAAGLVVCNADGMQTRCGDQARAVVGGGRKQPSAALDPSTLGTVSGTVRLDGKAPNAIKIDMSLDPPAGTVAAITTPSSMWCMTASWRMSISTSRPDRRRR